MENKTGKSRTKEELDAVRAAYADYVPVKEIAVQQQRSYMAIVSCLQRLGLMDELGNRIEVAA